MHSLTVTGGPLLPRQQTGCPGPGPCGQVLVRRGQVSLLRPGKATTPQSPGITTLKSPGDPFDIVKRDPANASAASEQTCLHKISLPQRTMEPDRPSLHRGKSGHSFAKLPDLTPPPPPAFPQKIAPCLQIYSHGDRHTIHPRTISADFIFLEFRRVDNPSSGLLRTYLTQH